MLQNKHIKTILLSCLVFLFAFSVPAISQADSVAADTDNTFEKVDIEASFSGGANGWRKFLERNLDPDVPVRKKAPAGTYTVIIQFVVDKNGMLSGILPLTEHGYGMEQEVIRILKISPKWTPAIQNGRPVKAYRRQPVTFMVVEEKKNKRGRN